MFTPIFCALSLCGEGVLKRCAEKRRQVISEAFLGDFLLKIGIIWYKDIRKDIPFYNYEGPPLATPTTQHHTIMKLWDFMKMHD